MKRTQARSCFSTEVDDGIYIRLINRLSGEVSSEFPSKCKHIPVSLISHPTDADFVLESCLVCKVIRNYNIHTTHCSIVYEGYTFYKMCRGPTGSIFALWFDLLGHQSPHVGISIMQWDKEHQKLRTDKTLYVESELIRMCYSELFDMLVVKDDENDIRVVKLESEADTSELSAPIWK